VVQHLHEAVEKEGANTAMIFVPPGSPPTDPRAEDAGIELIICITRGSRPRRAAVYNTLKKNGAAAWSGPTGPGILSPGKASVGIIPASFFSAGNVGVVSRSGTLTYQIGNVLAQSGFGNSTIVASAATPSRARTSSTCSACSRTTRDRADRDVRRDRRRRRGAGGRLHR